MRRTCLNCLWYGKCVTDDRIEPKCEDWTPVDEEYIGMMRECEYEEALIERVDEGRRD